MSNKTQLQTNNTELSQLITTLQGKATGSGGGGSVETCTVTISAYNGSDILYTALVDGEIQGLHIEGSFTSITLDNIVCNSVFTFGATGSYTQTSGDVTLLLRINSFMKFYKAPADAGAVATITNTID